MRRRRRAPQSRLWRSGAWRRRDREDRKSTRLNSSHTEIYTLSLHDALPISERPSAPSMSFANATAAPCTAESTVAEWCVAAAGPRRSEEHTSELQSHRDLHSFPTRRSSDLGAAERAVDEFCQCDGGAVHRRVDCGGVVRGGGGTA